MILPAYIWKYLMFLDLLPPCLSLPATFHAGLVTELPLGTSKGLIFPRQSSTGRAYVLPDAETRSPCERPSSGTCIGSIPDLPMGLTSLQ